MMCEYGGVGFCDLAARWIYTYASGVKFHACDEHKNKSEADKEKSIHPERWDGGWTRPQSKKRRRYVIQFVGVVPAHHVQTFSKENDTGKYLRGITLIGSAEKNGLHVASFIIDGREQLPSDKGSAFPRPLDMRTFSPSPLDSGMVTDVLQPERWIGIRLANLNDEPMDFSFSVVCEYAEASD